MQFLTNTAVLAPLLVALGLSTVAFGLYRLIHGLFFSPLRNIPGSTVSRLTAKRLEMSTIFGWMSHLGRGDYEKYGDVFIVTPSAVAISNPNDIRTVLGNAGVAKSSYYNILRFTGIDNTVSTQDFELANTRHRQLAPFFKRAYLAKMEPTIMRHGIEAIKRKWDGVIAESADGTAEVNYCNDFLFAAFDIIGTLVYGRQLEELNTNNAKTAKWIDTTVTYLGIRSMVQLVLKYPFSLLMQPWESRYDKLSAYINKAIHERKDHLARGKERPADLLQAFIDAEDPESRVRMCHEQIHGECVLMMLAGSDTTSHTISWTLHLLMLYPQHYRRALAEVRARFAPDHMITHDECRAQLPFIEACVLESLRLAPVTGGLLPRMAPRGGMHIQGHYIPEGTTVFINLAAANHHERVWQRPHEFDPTRFIDSPDARHNVLTFSHGRRTCPGKNLAMWEMLTILANVLKDYDMQLPADYTHLGPHILDKHGFPRQMDAQQYIVVKPVDAERDCRILISKRFVPKS
ncbi:hypothetical protein IWW50_002297 [Coemansia erecta]|nr:hypothetical protein GGF43_004339 [Coemansia sp. RSA 2618]KAJ2826568.1 hypothetical protein IWW50_002297 [Coemansia erecta]